VDNESEESPTGPPDEEEPPEPEFPEGTWMGGARRQGLVAQGFARLPVRAGHHQAREAITASPTRTPKAATPATK
jgi:hypothetical protein